MAAAQPSIELFGYVFDAPVNTLTDMILTVICLLAFLRLHRLPPAGEVHFLFKYYFLSMSLATFLGGIVGHALMPYLPYFMKLPGWMTSLVSVALLERSLIQYSRKFLPAKAARFFLALNLVELICFATLTAVTLDFKFVLIHAGLGIGIVVSGFALYSYSRERSEGMLQLLLGVLSCIAGAIVFIVQFGLSRWFNHVDVSHVFMMVACLLFYRASRQLMEAPEQERMKKPSHEARLSD